MIKRIQQIVIKYLWRKNPSLVRKYEKYLDWTKNNTPCRHPKT